jgi:hypothetical protein
MTGATSQNLDRPLRVDPEVLPARWKTRMGGGDRLASEAAVYMDVAGVIVKRSLSGLPLTLSLPFSAFEGVSVRIEPDGEDGLLARVELRHSDPDLSIPLVVTRHMEEAAEDWQGWARRLGLPMLLIERDGVAEPVGPATSLPTGEPVPRRRHASLVERRPRFNARRKMGVSGDMPVYRGCREIISYE